MGLGRVKINVHCSGIRVFDNTKFKINAGAYAVIITVHYIGRWASEDWQMLTTNP